MSKTITKSAGYVGRLVALTRGAWPSAVPSPSGPRIGDLCAKLYKTAGVGTVDVVPIPPGTADMSAQVQAELNKGIDFVYVLGDSTFCTTVLKATTVLGFKGTTALLSACIAPGAGTALPNGYQGMKTVIARTNSFSNKDVQTYLTAMKKWGSGTNPFT